MCCFAPEDPTVDLFSKQVAACDHQGICSYLLGIGEICSMYPGLCCCQRHIKTSNPGAELNVYIAPNQNSESPWFLARIQTMFFFFQAYRSKVSEEHGAEFLIFGLCGSYFAASITYAFLDHGQPN